MFQITHQVSSSIAAIMFALSTLVILHQGFALKIHKVTEHKRKKTTYTADDGWRGLVTQENIDKIAKLPVYQFCMSYVDAWHQMMNTIGNDSSSKSQSQNSNPSPNPSIGSRLSRNASSYQLDVEKNPSSISSNNSTQMFVKRSSLASPSAVGVITEVTDVKETD